MRRSERHPLLAGDIVDAVSFSREKFGERQTERYADAIEDAIDHITAFPDDGRRYRLGPGYWLFNIGRRGRRARHQLLYFIENDGSLLVLRLLHDRMSVRRHIPKH
jgi:toxin ParE1/3/4